MDDVTEEREKDFNYDIIRETPFHFLPLQGDRRKKTMILEEMAMITELTSYIYPRIR